VELPIKLNRDSATIIANWVVNPANPKHSKHLLEDRLERMEHTAGRVLPSKEDIELFLTDFLNGCNVYFSTAYVGYNQKVPEVVDQSLSDDIISVITEALLHAEKIKLPNGKRAPLWLIGQKLEPRNVDKLIYMYCVKDKAVLILSMEIHGVLVPRMDDWSLNFKFFGITFLNFEIEAEHIPSYIMASDLLFKINYCISLMFPIFMNQANIISQHYEEEKADEEALARLSSIQRKLLNVYLPIFDRYGDLDIRIDLVITKIEDRWRELGVTEYEWVIYSPSYCLPTWFEHFYEPLSIEEKIFLDKVDPNNITESDIIEIEKLLKEFYCRIDRDIF